jgi:hypothetical protein
MHPNPDAQIEPLSVAIVYAVNRVRRAVARAWRWLRTGLRYTWGYVKWVLWGRVYAREAVENYEARRKRAARRR